MPVTMGAEKEVPEAAVYRSSPGNVVLESVGEYVGGRSALGSRVPLSSYFSSFSMPILQISATAALVTASTPGANTSSALP